MPQTTIQVRRNWTARWTELNPILAAGEMGYELDTGKHKLGNGYTRWADLDYFIPEQAIRAAIQEALADAGPVAGPVGTDALTAHVNSTVPHPVYDDGPSLALLYQNAKV